MTVSRNKAENEQDWQQAEDFTQEPCFVAFGKGRAYGSHLIPLSLPLSSLWHTN